MNFCHSILVLDALLVLNKMINTTIESERFGSIGDQVGQSNGSVLGLLSLRNTGTPVRASPTFVVTNSTSFDPIFLT